MGRLVTAGLVLALALVPAQALQAQDAGGGAQLEVTGFAGGALFMSDLADFIVPPGGERITEPKMENGVVVGAHLGFRFGQVSVEGTAAYVPGSYSGTQSGGDRSVDTNLTVLGASLLYTLPSENQLMEVFLAGGAGLKMHSPDIGDSESNPYGSVGGGLRIFVTPSAALRFELRDYISPFTDGNLQNDLFITAGLSFSPSGS